MGRAVAIVILITAIVAIGWVAFSSDDVETAADTPTPTPEAEPAASAEPAPTPAPFPEPENYGPRMDLVNIDGWLQTDATSIDDFDGQVLLVEMWTFGCHNCKARIPYNQSYYEEFGDENFEILGVHAPEFSYEAEVPAIEAALERLGVPWPQALDTDKKNFRAWQPGTTNFWPRTYVIDQNGDIRYDHIGEGKYEELRETIRYLIENPPPPTAET
ncbi:MAG: redoxin domain-containing protein [Actinomycetota bacterium]